MTTSVLDDPTQVIIKTGGIQGPAGTDGTDGIGFNNVRESIIQNPLSYLYKKNNLVENLDQLLTVDRAVGGNYTDIYGVVQAASPDEPREEAKGWLITDDETDTFNVYNNIPLLDSGFTCVIEVGSYLGGSPTQSIISVPSTTGVLFTVGTDGLGNFIAALRGSDLVTYEAVTTVDSTVSTRTSLVITFDGDDLNMYINNTLEGTIALATGITDAIDTGGIVTINGDYTMNLLGVRFYDIILNTDEIEYLS